MAIGNKTVPRRTNSFSERIYLIAVFKGMGLTFSHFLKNLFNTSRLRNTEYPEQQPSDITNVYRGVHRLTKNKDGSIKCVACFMCATYCPSDCIFIEAMERNDGVKEKAPKKFTIDMLECVYCGLCVEACPHDAIKMDTGIFSLVGKNRDDFLFNRDKLLSHEAMRRK